MVITLSETGVSSVLSPSSLAASSSVPSGTVVSSEGTEVPSVSSAVLVLSSCDTSVTAVSDELSDCSVSSGTSASPVTVVTVVSWGAVVVSPSAPSAALTFISFNTYLETGLLTVKLLAIIAIAVNKAVNLLFDLYFIRLLLSNAKKLYCESASLKLTVTYPFIVSISV